MNNPDTFADPGNPEWQAELTPTIADLVEAVRGTIDEEAVTYEVATSSDFTELYGALYALLLGEGIDPDEFFEQHGIAIENQPSEE